MNSGKLDPDGIYADPYNQHPNHPDLYNPDDVSRWLAHSPDEVIWEIFVEIMQQYQIIRGFTKVMYEAPNAETIVVTRNVYDEEVTLRDISEQILIASNVMRRILDTASTYSRQLREQNQRE